MSLMSCNDTTNLTYEALLLTEEKFTSALPLHPSGRECYSVIVSVTKSRHYLYSVSGTGIVQDHFKIVDGETTALDIPIWLIDDKPELSKLPKSQHYTELE